MTPQQIEAMKMALEALEGVLDDSPKILEASISGGLYEVVQCREAITAIKEHLDKKWSDYPCYEWQGYKTNLGYEGTAVTAFYRKPDAVMEMFYSQFHPMAQPEQEPVAYLCENAVGHKYFRWKKPSSTYKPIALYTTPPQRTWVGLTNDEINNFAAGCHLGKSVQGAIYEAEAKLKEKNT